MNEVANPEPSRRGFLHVLAAGMSFVLAAIPLGAGLALFFDPLRRKGNEKGILVKVANLGQIPADGVPRRFAVVADKTNAWNQTKDQIGAVYLRRTKPDAKPECLSDVCPHLGCQVPWVGGKFSCPCHSSSFEADGVRIDPDHAASPRNMDSLEVDVKGDDVWVVYQKFAPGTHEKKPI